MNIMGQECERCHKRVWQEYHADSTDLIVTDGELLFMGDMQECESSRPCLLLKSYFPERQHCIPCLRAVVNEWMDKVEARGESEGVANRTYGAP